MVEGQASTPPKGPQTIISTVESSDTTVKSSRNEIPLGVGGSPIQRIPYSPQIKAMVESGIYQKRIASQERCLRPVELPLKGGTVATFACSRPVVGVGTDGDKYCPEHDKEAFRPQQTHAPTNQRVFNSASIELTESERQVVYEKDGKKVIADLKDGKDLMRRIDPLISASNIVSTVKLKRAPRSNTASKRLSAPKGGSIRLEFTLEELKSDQIGSIFVEKAVEGIGKLPAKNLTEMQSLTKIQDHLRGLEEGK